MTVRTGSYAKIKFPPTIGHDLRPSQQIDRRQCLRAGHIRLHLHDRPHGPLGLREIVAAGRAGVFKGLLNNAGKIGVNGGVKTGHVAA